jgi:hypothetical protein
MLSDGGFDNEIAVLYPRHRPQEPVLPVTAVPGLNYVARVVGALDPSSLNIPRMGMCAQAGRLSSS